MATAPNVDLSTLTSSADVFASNYTLPQIRALHRNLHVAVDDKASRLRTQVGSSYRDLLGTADLIVQMRTDNEAVQNLLGGMGSRCGRGVVNKKVSGLANLSSKKGVSEEKGHVGLVTRARLLERCSLVVARVLRDGTGLGESKLSRGDRLLLASKVLVLSRLLTKSFAEEEDHDMGEDVTTGVESAKKTLRQLKRRVLRGIEKVLERTTEVVSQDDLLKTLCAYSLATSSGARDVLWHFLQVRGSALALAFEPDDDGRWRGSDHVLDGLKLYTRTLLDVQAFVPNRLSDALSRLKKHPLLVDEALRTLEGLRLDIFERWCGEEIQYFTPFVRHDDLDGPQARNMLSSWAKKGGQVLQDGLTTTLERVTEFKTITDIRTGVLQLWIRDGGKARGFDPSEMLDTLRGVINQHMLQVLDTKVNKLQLVASEVLATLDAWHSGVTDKKDDLWVERSLDTELSAGADHFLQDLIARLHGRNNSVSRTVNCFNSWKHVVDDVGQVVEQLKKQRWDNDVDEIEDEETIEERQQLLSKDDPTALQTRFDKSLESSFKTLDDKLSELWKAHSGSTNTGKVAMYFIRVLRDIRSGLPKIKSSNTVKGFGLSMVPLLHEKLALAVSLEPLDTFAVRGLTQKKIIGRALWEGSPELPLQPSPRAFKFLQHLSHTMDDAGMDLWSPAALVVLRRHLQQELNRLWTEAIEARLTATPPAQEASTTTEGTADKLKADESESVLAVEESKANKTNEAEQEGSDKDSEADGEEEDDSEDKEEGELINTKDSDARPDDEQKLQEQTVNKDVFVQWLFDIGLLRAALVRSGETADELEKVEDQIFQHSGLDSVEARQRLAKSSGDYWKKTGLLFGLLSS